MVLLVILPAFISVAQAGGGAHPVDNSVEKPLRCGRDDSGLRASEPFP
jgi:hypothetical protein